MYRIVWTEMPPAGRDPPWIKTVIVHRKWDPGGGDAGSGVLRPEFTALLQVKGIITVL